MGMNPMMMQNMFMNGGFGAQGMNGMSMNMGMNGFNGGGNDWNGQQSWNVGQDNFNPNAPGMGNGDFGNFNTGFRNYGHQNHFNDYRRGNYGFRAHEVEDVITMGATAAAVINSKDSTTTST